MGNNFNTNAEIRDQDNQADGMKTETAYDTNDDTMIYNSFGFVFIKKIFHYSCILNIPLYKTYLQILMKLFILE